MVAVPGPPRYNRATDSRPMPRETRSRRLARPAAGAPPPAGAATSAALWSLLARSSRTTELLPWLHQHVLDSTGGRCSLLFRYNPRDGALLASSGFGLDDLPTDAWTPTRAEADLVNAAFATAAPIAIGDLARQAPALARRLPTRAALVCPLTRHDERLGVLAIGFETPAAAGAAAQTCREPVDAVVAALDLLRLRQAEDLQRDLRGLLDEFAESLGATLSLAGGLDIFCHGANRFFGADRTSVWIHDRRARHLVLRASSDPAHAARGVHVSADDPTAPAALGMRRARAEMHPRGDGAPTATVTVPLRGTRRALGTIVFEGVRVEPGEALDLLDRADAIGLRLSSAVENLQLLDDVMRSRRELENTFDSIAHLVAVSDRRGRIVHVNQPFANRLGLSSDQLLDKPLADYIGPELAAWLAERHAGPPGAQGTEAATIEVADPVLQGPFMVTATDLVDHERQRVGSVIVARDLTPQTRLEAEREELRRRLGQSEKLAALGQFVAGIAHELNNPLQGVLGHLELLRVTGAFPKQLRREVQTIYREADRAAKIVRNLLVFAGSRRGARRAVSVNAVLHKVVALRAAACRSADIEIVRHYDDKLPRVASDPLLLHQVFLNMVVNAEHAVAATGHPGRIEISTMVAGSGDRILVTIRDTGEGIPPDALSRIFEPFYTTKEVGKGTGLGLAIAYGIVQDHGGLITASNHPEGGAVITVELPAAPAAGRQR
jgi:PAS domain S-box-containing protein